MSDLKKEEKGKDRLSSALEEQTQPERLTLLAVLAIGCWGIGDLFARFGSLLQRGFRAFYRAYLKRGVQRLKLVVVRIGRRLARVVKKIAGTVSRFVHFFSDAVRVLRNGYQKGGFGGMLGAFAQGMSNNSHLFVTIINYTLPVVAILCVAHVVNYVQNLDFAVSVEYNGEHIGYIADETVFEEAETKLQQRLTYLPEDEIVDTVPRFAVSVVSEPSVKSSAELTDAIIQNAGTDMVEATGIYIDGELLGVVKDYTQVNTVLNQMLDEYRSGDAGERVEFTKDVQSEAGLYLAANLVDEQSVIDEITSETSGAVYYTVQSGDAPSTIAQSYDMTTDELVSMNPGILDSLLVGQSVLVSKSQPYLPVQTVRTETYEQDIPYGTTVTTSDKYYEGETRTVSAGVAGKKSVTAEISYVDGIEVSRTVLSETVLSEPVNAVVAKGTKVMQKAEVVAGSQVANSGMINPIQSKSPYISQRYKGTAHNGIDIAFRGGNGYGTPIVSVLPGTVTYAGWRGTYGNLVIVDHGNGYQTWYAHCSKLYVSAGQKVVQGETIAAVGNTGRSTGNHLHFRVIANGVQVNPLSYIPGF